jgi:hypothetical protein
LGGRTVNAERIEQARRFGGELCDIDGCTEYGTLEHVTAHLAAIRRLDELRAVLRAENISYGELAELQSLAAYIRPGDVELAEPAGIPESEFVNR